MDTKILTKFKRLTKEGNTPEQIMEKMNISRATYFNYKKEVGDKRYKVNRIDKQAYYREIRNEYKTKDELATRLKVSKPTLIKFETDNEVQFVISRGFSVQSNTISLHKMLHISKEKAREYTNGMPNFKGVVNSLKIIIGTLEKFAEYNPEITAKIDTLKQAYNLVIDMPSKVVSILENEAQEKL